MRLNPPLLLAAWLIHLLVRLALTLLPFRVLVGQTIAKRGLLGHATVAQALVPAASSLNSTPLSPVEASVGTGAGAARKSACATSGFSTLSTTPPEPFPQDQGRRPSSPLFPQSAAQAIRTTSRLVPAHTCLTQALALKYLLRLSGTPATLWIGVGPTPAQHFQAHAWLESGGQILLGETAPGAFLPLVSLQDAPQ